MTKTFIAFEKFDYTKFPNAKALYDYICQQSDKGQWIVCYTITFNAIMMILRMAGYGDLAEAKSLGSGADYDLVSWRFSK